MIGLDITKGVIYLIPGEKEEYLFIINNMKIFQLKFVSSILNKEITISYSKVSNSTYEIDINEYKRIKELISLGFSNIEAIQRVLSI